MSTNSWKKIFTPGPYGRLRWAIIGIAVLFIFALFIDVTGINNPVSRGFTNVAKAIPIVRDIPVWPQIQLNPIDNSKSLVFKSAKDLDFTKYGFPFTEGLDLKGGAHLTYDADVTNIPQADRASALNGVRDVIERRVNTLGVSEPLVQTNQQGNTWRVLVDLAGITDVNTAIKMIGETPTLEFKEQNTNVATMTPELTAKMNADNAAIKLQAEDVLKKALAGEDFGALAKQYSQDPGSKDNGGLYQGVKKGQFVAQLDEVIFNKLKPGEIDTELVQSDFGYHIVKLEKINGTGTAETVDMRHILLLTKKPADYGIVSNEWSDTQLTGKQLTKASVELNPSTGVPEISLEFNSDGANLFADITKRNVGKPVAIFLDGQIISSPRVDEAILSGKAVINGNFTLTDAKLLAQRLNAGALPVPIKLISQTTVGASLGSESVNKSLAAGIFGLILVIIFMLAYYRLPGLLAIMALGVYVALNLMFFKLIPVTLTLAGIAGFILSIGMAVDANVLIFERLKEELRAGRESSSAVDEGFRRAWSSVRDSNISSLITCVILYWFGSSLVKGFAFTLALGILLSMFSAVTITRQLLKLFSHWKVAKSEWLYGVGKKKAVVKAENK